MQLTATGTRENRWRALELLIRVALRRTALSSLDQQVTYQQNRMGMQSGYSAVLVQLATG